jgi:hypothetical protein
LSRIKSTKEEQILKTKSLLKAEQHPFENTIANKNRHTTQFDWVQYEIFEPLAIRGIEEE